MAQKKNLRFRIGQGFIALGLLLVCIGVVTFFVAPRSGPVTTPGAGLWLFFLILYIAMAVALSLLVGGFLLLLERRKAAAPPGIDANEPAILSSALGVAALLITWFLVAIGSGLIQPSTYVFMFPLPFATILAGAVGMARAKKPGVSGGWQASLGLALGIIALLWSSHIAAPSIIEELSVRRETRTFVFQVEELKPQFEKPDQPLPVWMEWHPSIMFQVDHGGTEVEAACEDIRWADRCFCLHKEAGEGGADTMQCVLCDDEAVAHCDAWLEYPKLSRSLTVRLEYQPSSTASERLDQLKRDGARFQIEMDVRGNQSVNGIRSPSPILKGLLVDGRPVRDLLQ